MFVKKILLMGGIACAMLPAWTAIAASAVEPQHKEAPLLIGTSAMQKVDPSLRIFIERVLMESPAMLGAQAAVEAARARSDSAGRPLYNPSLELDAENASSNTTSIGFRQAIDWSDKREAQTRIAGYEIEAATAALREVRQRVAAETLGALTRHFTARETQALAKRRSQLMKDFTDTVKQRQAAGDMGALDGTLAQVAYSEALMQQAASEGELAEAEAALQAVTGLVAGLDLERWPQLPSELAAPPEQIAPVLLQSLPTLAVLQNRMKAAKARVRLVERESRVDPTIGIRAGREDSDLLLGLSLEIPLFVRNNFKAEVRVAAHEAIEEELIYRDAYRRAKARLDGGLGRFRNTTRAWRAWVATGQQAHREQISLLEQMWQAGELTATDYLIQAKQNIDTQAAATALMGEVWQAAIAWLDASAQVGDWLGIAPTVAAQRNNSGE